MWEQQELGQRLVRSRQPFGVRSDSESIMLTLHQQGTVTLTELSRYIRIDRSTLGEMISRMEQRSLDMRQSNGNHRRSANMSLTPSRPDARVPLVSGVAQLQTV